jgi:uncharacterized DUF497 family protein
VFAWDAAKARQNLRKHGVSFEEAATVFADPESLDWEDVLNSEHEARLKRMGSSAFERILVVVYTLRRTSNEQETIRIISPRRASPKERKLYHG